MYPLSQYLRRRPSVVNGTVVCESASATSQMSINLPKIPPDQRLSQSSLSTGQKKENMSEQFFDKDNKTPDAKLEADTNMSEAQYPAMENASKGVEVTQETPKEEIGQMHCPLVHPNNKETESEDDDFICLIEALARTESAVEPGNAPPQQSECWDEYDPLMFPGVANWQQTSLLSSAENRRHPPSGWHFPAGPDGKEEIFCPRWQFPTLSYHPSLEQTTPFEVMWRPWQDVSTQHSDTFTKPSMDFTVMSYNILAQDLLEDNIELYMHCSREVLEWSNRYRLLLEEIQKWAPDILCLQEVQENHYQTQLQPFLTQMGYNCVYKQRTGNKTDGCATCYRSSRFSEVSVKPVEFLRPQTKLLDRHNVGIIVLLRPVVYQGSEVTSKGSLLCVANTHLLFNPRRGDIKLAQLAIMLAEINSVVKTWKNKGEHCNVILCGDFNSVPRMPLYQFITTGELDFQGLPTWMVSGQKDFSHKATHDVLRAPLWPDCLGISDRCQYVASGEVNASHNLVTAPTGGKRHYSHNFLLELRFCPLSCIRPSDLPFIPGLTDNNPDVSSRTDFSFQHKITHQLDLESAYEHALADSADPEVTTLHSEGGAIVDYIFYSPERISAGAGQFGREGLKLLGYLSLLSEESLCSMESLPSYIFPSDHLSLVAKFQLDLNTEC